METFLVALPSGEKIAIEKREIIIGRNSDSDVEHPDKKVSRRHCMITKKGITFYIADLESTNGTFVNGQKILGEAMLHNNDTISIGRKAVAYQFRQTIVDFRTVIESIRKPIVYIPASAGVLAILIVLFYFLFFANAGKVDIKKGLERIRETYGENTIPSDPVFLAALDKSIELLKKDPGFAPTLERRNLYKDSIELILAENGLDPVFSYMPWAESGYTPDAYNAGSRAAGMWQFIPETARHYGLRVDGTTDERFDPGKATIAAAACIKDLVSIFGNDSFPLVLASYNAGENAVLYGLRQIENPVADRNYWYLATHDLIPEETKRYVMMIIALIVIADSE
jgi:hypothetical protein